MYRGFAIFIRGGAQDFLLTVNCLSLRGHKNDLSVFYYLLQASRDAHTKRQTCCF